MKLEEIQKTITNMGVLRCPPIINLHKKHEGWGIELPFLSCLEISNGFIYLSEKWVESAYPEDLQKKVEELLINLLDTKINSLKLHLKTLQIIKKTFNKDERRKGHK